MSNLPLIKNSSLLPLLMLTLEVKPPYIYKWFVPHGAEIWTKQFWSKLNKMLSFLAKERPIFRKHLCTAESILMWNCIWSQTTVFQCSKIYRSLTRVARLKLAPNICMADPVTVLTTQTDALKLTFSSKITYKETSYIENFPI